MSTRRLARLLVLGAARRRAYSIRDIYYIFVLGKYLAQLGILVGLGVGELQARAVLCA